MENELRIVDAVSVPVLAAGGITDVRGVRAARALGAEGFYIGSRFIVTKENMKSNIEVVTEILNILKSIFGK